MRKYARIAKVSLKFMTYRGSENRLRGLAINDALLLQEWRSLAIDVLRVTDRCATCWSFLVPENATCARADS